MGAAPQFNPLKAPFPYFGGKSKVTGAVWNAFGPVSNYVEPFFGSGACLLGRPPGFTGPETVNDADGFIANFWRALQADPDGVAEWADWPINEADLMARHHWLIAKKFDLINNLEADPDWYDSKVAGWWVWGLNAWIGGAWCSGRGPWQVVDGVVVDVRKHPELKTPGFGVSRRRPNAINVGINRKNLDVPEYFTTLAKRLKNVRVCCGDWSRVVAVSTTTSKPGITAVFLDPPYNGVHAMNGSSTASDAGKWAIENGDNPRLRIALCGYDKDHVMPDNWECYTWNTQVGMSRGVSTRTNTPTDSYNNARSERIWFSPHCLSPRNSGIPA